MDKVQEKYWRNKIQSDLKEFKEHSNLNWLGLIGYLNEEKEEGKTEFRLVVHENNILIHPIDKDGKTLDLELFPPQQITTK